MPITLNGTTGIDTPALDSDALPTVNGGEFPLSGFRNKIIGGDFTTNPWQRGTSFTGPTSAYTADRFAYYASSDAVVNVLKTADAPTAAQAGVYTQHCLHVDVTTADTSIAAGQYAVLFQAIEGLNAASFGFGQAGSRFVTLSFWHKHTKTGTYCVALRNSAGDRSYVAEYQQNVTNTWERESITIPVDTSGTWLYDTGIGIRLTWAIASGSNSNTSANTWTNGVGASGVGYWGTANQVNALDSTANDFKIALVQLESGSVATPFETRSVGQELALCQRYYYRMSGAVTYATGFAYATNGSYALTTFPVTMRSAPTALEQSGTASNYILVYDATQANCSSVPAFGSATIYSARTEATVSSGLTVGRGSLLFGTSSAYLGWSAEL